jgi:serine/threonine protein kinase
VTPYRWRQIEALYLAALDRSGSERDALLSAADPDIAREVRSMLAKSGKEPPPPPSAAWRVPEMIGVYRVEGRIGQGGMGMVYRAFDTKLNRPVAIKFLADTFADANARRRFQREAQTASSLNHPHIVTVYDIGEIEDQQYLVTEYVEEGTLRAWVQNPRGWRPVVEMIIGVADALATAHAANILHRDIKPENVLFTKSGYAKLTDFGLAKIAESDPGSLATVDATGTRPGVIMGTIAYMSPEQASGRNLDARSDIFSFGVMLYELLSGSQPFTGATDLETLQRVIHAAPPVDYNRNSCSITRNPG